MTHETSLFDYAPGYSTASYTLESWPEYEATSCRVQEQLPGIPVAEPLPQIPLEQAMELCKAVRTTGSSTGTASGVRMPRQGRQHREQDVACDREVTATAG